MAAFHPEGSKFAAYTSGGKRASGMSYFSIGGNVGYALGPIVATPLVLWLGLRGGLLLALPSLALAAAMLAAMPYLRSFVPDREAHRAAGGRDRPGAMALLLGVIAFRSVAWFGLVTFVPLWEVSLGHSKAEGNRLLALMLVAGGAGTLLMGPLAACEVSRSGTKLRRYGVAARMAAATARLGSASSRPPRSPSHRTSGVATIGPSA